MISALDNSTTSRSMTVRSFLTMATALLVFLALSASSASAATLQVCSTCAYTTIQSAVSAASSGDVIEVAPGTYAESVSISGALSLSILPTSGQVTVDATGFDRALEILDPGASIILQDFELINAEGYAGLVNHGRATLVTVYVKNNSGTYGGIFNTGSLLTFNNSVIANNSTSTLGSSGGLNNFGQADLWNTTINGNVGHEGGGFNSLGNSRVTAFYSSISGNHATSTGGGYFTSSPQALVDIKSTSSLSSNVAPYCAAYYDVQKTPDCVN